MRLLSIAALALTLPLSITSAQEPIKIDDPLTPGRGNRPTDVFLVDSSNAIHVEPFYELRIYTANPGKLDELHARFRDHTMAIFERHGMKNVAYWTPITEGNNRLVYLLEYPDRETRETAWTAFREDPDWQAAYKASTAEGKLVANVESTFLGTTDWSPQLDENQKEDSSSERLFEMREYTTNPGKLPDLHKRFQDHTVALFEKHGIENLPYFAVLGQEEADPIDDDTLLYFIAHKDEAARTASFEAFGNDPAWKEAKEASEANGSLLVPKGVTSVLLKPTDYSPMK